MKVTIEVNKNLPYPEKLSLIFAVFLLWTFVLLSRPQDIFTVLAPLRPALAVSLFAAVCFLFKFLTSGFHTDVSFPRSRQTNLFIALVCVMIIGVPFAFYRRGAFLFILDYIMKVVLFYFIFTKMVDTVRKLEIAILICCFGTGFYATMAIIQGILKGQRLTYGGMFDPNDLAFFTLSFLPFNFLFMSKKSPLYQRIFSIVGSISSVLVILMSGSRGGFLAFLIIIVFAFAMKTRSIKNWYKITMVVVSFIVLSFNITTIDFSRYRTITTIGSDYNVTSEWGRWRVWKEGIGFMFNNPLLGVGVSCFDNALGTMRAEQGRPPKWQTAHNSFVLVGAETGLVGFVLFSLMNLNALKIFWRSGKEPASEDLLRIAEMTKIGFVGHLVCITFLSQAYSFYWTFYIALSCVLPRFMMPDAQTEFTKAQPALMPRPEVGR